jgi:hypothetical protein
LLKLFFIAPLFFLACAQPLTSGTVIEKKHIPGHFEQYKSSEVCASYNKDGTCQVTIPIYSTRWVDDEYLVRLINCDKPYDSTHNECVTGWVEVSKGYYLEVRLNVTKYGE